MGRGAAFLELVDADASLGWQLKSPATDQRAADTTTPEAVIDFGRVSVYRAQEGRRRPIVPQGCPCSIVGAGGLNDRVRDGNGCVPSARVTSPPARTDAKEMRDEMREMSKRVYWMR